ncbi:MAG: tetratricopeptide repeat protein [Tenuifilaceae bacterium]
MCSLEKGLAFLSAGDIEKAHECFTLAMNNDQQNFLLWFNRGKVYRLKGDFIAAINDFQKALDINPDFKEAEVSIEMLKNIISFRNPDLLNH